MNSIMLLDVQLGAAKEEFSLIGLLIKGGVIMIPIALLSVMAVYFIIERLLYIRNAGRINPQHMVDLKRDLKDGKLKEGIRHCKDLNTAWGNIFANGVRGVGSSMDEIQDRIDDAANVEVAKMERNLNFLSIIAGAAPLLGFIGTIIGVITIFFDIANSEDNLSISLISEGLYKKMVTSAAGLTVGIVAFAGYHLLQGRIDKFINKVDEDVVAFKATLRNTDE
ncbi:MAG: MotA/TolQ/ExbB proton channel family protein [Flavobacteriales bacterium]